MTAVPQDHRRRDECPTCGAPVAYTPAGSNHVVGDWNEEWTYDPQAPPAGLTVERLAALLREAVAATDQSGGVDPRSPYYSHHLAVWLLPHLEMTEVLRAALAASKEEP